MNYKSVVVTQRGGPEVLKIVKNEMREPASGEARIKIEAVSVGRTDINYRYGYSPLSPKVPFVPGYSILGTIDALGTPSQQGTKFSVGDRVAALTGHGGYTEVMYLGQEHLVRVPRTLDAAETAVLILNYTSAYQMLHRVAKVKAGDKILLIGASGGVGTAFLQLGCLAGLKMYGTASPSKYAILTASGAIPIDYTTQDFVGAIQRMEPGGLDFVFDGMGGKLGDRGMEVLKRGGKLVGYAAPTGLSSMLLGALKLAFAGLALNGKKAEFYGITAIYMVNKKTFMEDLPVLFKMLEEGKIKPVIAAKLPILEAAKANEMLECGTVTGNIVLMAPELL